MKGKIALVGVLVLVGLGFYKMYEIGQEKYMFEVVGFDKFVPIPMLYDQYTGFAVALEGRHIRATWNHILPPENPSVSYFNCLGYINPGPQLYYVLEVDGKIYLEKAEYIEPLIKALCALHRGGPEDNHPEAMEDVLACLPDDHEVMLELVSRFKKK